MDKTCYNWIQCIKKSPLPSNAKLVAFYLGTFMNLEHDMAWPSLKRIACETGLSKPTVMKYISVLCDNGYLIKDKRVEKSVGGEQLHNVYYVDIPEKVVKELTYLPKGGKSDNQRGVNSSTKGGKELNPNINRISKNNKRENLPFWNDETGWINLGKKYGIEPKRGESLNNFSSRVKGRLDYV